jgi:hypothetical protein
MLDLNLSYFFPITPGVQHRLVSARSAGSPDHFLSCIHVCPTHFPTRPLYQNQPRPNLEPATSSPVMAPNPHDRDSYRQYKIDTSIFLYCVADSPKRRGHLPQLTLVGMEKRPAVNPVPSVPVTGKSPGRLKGHARKAAKHFEEQKNAALAKSAAQDASRAGASSPPKYRVTTVEILRQVEAICKAKRKVVIGSSIQRAAFRAIQLRERSAIYFQDKGDELTKDGHVHCITTLKRAVQSLQDSGCFQSQLLARNSNHSFAPKLSSLFEQLSLDTESD